MEIILGGNTGEKRFRRIGVDRLAHQPPAENPSKCAEDGTRTHTGIAPYRILSLLEPSFFPSEPRNFAEIETFSTREARKNVPGVHTLVPTIHRIKYPVMGPAAI